MINMTMGQISDQQRRTCFPPSGPAPVSAAGMVDLGMHFGTGPVFNTLSGVSGWRTRAISSSTPCR